MPGYHLDGEYWYRIEGSDIHENKEGVGWKWGLGILLPQEMQIICLPEAFRLSPSSEVFYFKKKDIKM